jgi:hypothetical protein
LPAAEVVSVGPREFGGRVLRMVARRLTDAVEEIRDEVVSAGRVSERVHNGVPNKIGIGAYSNRIVTERIKNLGLDI